jgi:hypothetical protein
MIRLSVLVAVVFLMRAKAIRIEIFPQVLVLPEDDGLPDHLNHERLPA